MVHEPIRVARLGIAHVLVIWIRSSDWPSVNFPSVYQENRGVADRRVGLPIRSGIADKEWIFSGWSGVAERMEDPTTRQEHEPNWLITSVD